MQERKLGHIFFLKNILEYFDHSFMLAACRDVKLEYKVLKEKVKEINKKDAQFYGNMFAKLNKLEPFDTEVSFTGSFSSFV